MDSFKARAQRSVQGRRGCRATRSVEDRYAILGFVIWHNESYYVQDSLLIAEGEKPGIIASYIYQKFKREFEREESERNGIRLPDSNMAYRHQFDALGGKADPDLRADRGDGRLRLLSQRLDQLVPPRGITFAPGVAQGPRPFNYTASVRPRRWRP